jgi:pyridoxal phosphate enzyme (YggS family)
MTGSAEQALVDDRVAANLADVRTRIAAAAKTVGRDPAEVTLVAVSKAQPDARVLAALAAGQRVFGENYVQEAKARWPALKRDYPDVVLHMIGPIQTNKARDVVALFDVIETVDRSKLAGALAKEMARLGRRPGCLIEVNTGEEPQKAGVVPAAADAFIRECRDELGLPVVGLMAIPPEGDEPSLHFALLADIARRNGLTQLSMGMSADYEIAVQFGATHVRVGSAIFGERPSKSGSAA